MMPFTFVPALLCAAAVLVAQVNANPPQPPPLGKVAFNATFSDYQVLQQQGLNSTKSAVYGTAPANAALAITVNPSGATASGTVPASPAYTVKATTSADGQWKAFLHPEADGGEFTVTAHCVSGCANKTDAVLKHVTFGV